LITDWLRENGVRSLLQLFRSKTRKTENEDRKWELTWLRENGVRSLLSQESETGNRCTKGGLTCIGLPCETQLEEGVYSLPSYKKMKKRRKEQNRRLRREIK
jgi:hypothetical protein